MWVCCLFFYLCSSLCYGFENLSDSEGCIISSLDLPTVLQRVREYSPALSIAATEVEMRISEEQQVGLWPNPVASVEVDGADSMIVSRKRRGDGEVFYNLSQEFELGGKRSARQSEAFYRTSLALWDLDSVTLDIEKNATLAMIDVMAAQEYLKVAIEQHHISREMLSNISLMEEAGRATALEIKKAKIGEARAALAVDQARRELETSKKKLCSLWGSLWPDFTEVVYPIFDMDFFPGCYTLEVLQLLQKRNNPDITRWEIEIAVASKAIALERANAVPDLTLNAGYVSGGGNSWIFGLSIPIPIFDRNQGNISRAQQQLQQLYERREETFIVLGTTLMTAYEEVLAAHREATSFKETLLSSANFALESAQDGFSEGKYGYFDLLDAQRTLFELQGEYIAALVEYHYKCTAVYRLIGNTSAIPPKDQDCFYPILGRLNLLKEISGTSSHGKL